MKRVKWRKTNDYLKSLETEQSRRLSDCGINAYKAYRMPNLLLYPTYGTFFTDRYSKLWCLLNERKFNQMI